MHGYLKHTITNRPDPKIAEHWELRSVARFEEEDDYYRKPDQRNWAIAESDDPDEEPVYEDIAINDCQVSIQKLEETLEIWTEKRKRKMAVPATAINDTSDAAPSSDTEPAEKPPVKRPRHGRKSSDSSSDEESNSDTDSPSPEPSKPRRIDTISSDSSTTTTSSGTTDESQHSDISEGVKETRRASCAPSLDPKSVERIGPSVHAGKESSRKGDQTHPPTREAKNKEKDPAKNAKTSKPKDKLEEKKKETKSATEKEEKQKKQKATAP